MADDGETKDDVKVPEGEVGDKITKLFKDEEKDLSEYSLLSVYAMYTDTQQMSSYSRRWVRRSPLKLRKPLVPLELPAGFQQTLRNRNGIYSLLDIWIAQYIMASTICSANISCMADRWICVRGILVRGLCPIHIKEHHPSKVQILHGVLTIRTTIV